eukprot:COSAG02_NODE_9315_length_2258_cov_2.237610_1_plen_109_part_00
MKEGVAGMLRVQYAPSAPNGHRSILYITIDTGHKASLCPVSTESHGSQAHDESEPSNRPGYHGYHDRMPQSLIITWVWVGVCVGTLRVVCPVYRDLLSKCIVILPTVV